MKIYLVGVSDCEANDVKCLCATRPIAERELFRVRDILVAEYKKMEEHEQGCIEKICKEENKPIWIDESYKKMIQNLSGYDYENWKNYPHDTPYIIELEVLEK